MEDKIKVEEFYFDYIDCPNCANKVEIALNKSSKIIEAHVIFLSKKIKVKHKEKDIYDEVCKIVKSLEKETNVFRNCGVEEKHTHHHESCCNHEKCACSSNKNNRDFRKKLVFRLGFILFLLANVYFVLGNKEILELINIEPIISGSAYIIPLFVLYIGSYILLAYDLVYKSIYGLLHKDYFNESLLMVIASMGAIVLSFVEDIELFEACAVVLLYKIGEMLQNRALEKSRNAITSLMDLDIDYVTTLDGEVKNVSEVKVGEKITIKAGEKIPLDGKIIAGGTNLDMKVLTGESEPVYVKKDDNVLAGSLNLTNVVIVEVLKEVKDSTIAKVKKVCYNQYNKK